MNPLRVLAPLVAALALTPAVAAARPVHYAVIGDTPYGDAQIADFPGDVAEINADPDVSLTLHVGDIKNGSSLCDTSYFELIRKDFDGFADPFVYTPGDNEWTDCHRANNGGYQPTERLDAIRRTFFPVHGRTLGRSAEAVVYQSDAYPENVRWAQSGVTFAVAHVVGS